MLPVSVLPVVGLFLGLGSAEFSWLPEGASVLMATGGGAVFSLLPLLFAIGVALGFSQNDGVAALAAVIGHTVMVKTMDLWVQRLGGIASDTGVAGGIIIGLMVVYLFKHCSQIVLPNYLGFFSGKRLVLIITSVASLFVAVALAYLWPPIAIQIKVFSHWASQENPLFAFTLYGIVERALIPLGLHHIWNTPFFFEVGSYLDPQSGQTVTGEIARFLKGDPTAGYLAGGYLFKMWGLPAAALAMAHSVKDKTQKKEIMGLMISAALTSFLTGITEPIEFSFLFVAPLLYALHALLSGLAFAVCIVFDIRHGTTFSHGLIDYLVLLPKSTHAYWLWILGPLWAVLYYAVFRFCISYFNLKTLGREIKSAPATEAMAVDSNQPENIVIQIITGLGGAQNIKKIDACITRLRLELVDSKLIQEKVLRQCGASGVFKLGSSVQVVMGTQSDYLKTQIKVLLDNATVTTNLLQSSAGKWSPLSSSTKEKWNIKGPWLVYIKASHSNSRVTLQRPDHVARAETQKEIDHLRDQIKKFSWVMVGPSKEGYIHLVGPDINKFFSN